MKKTAPVMAGTALALVLAAAHATAAPQAGSPLPFGGQPSAVAPQAAMLLAQADTDEAELTEEELLRLRQQQEEEEQDGAPAEDAPAAEEAPAEEPAAEEDPAEEPAEEQPREDDRAVDEAPADEPTAAEPIPGQPEAPPADGGATPPPPPPADGGGAEPIPGQPETPPADGGTTPPPSPPADGGGAEPIPGQPEAPPADGGATPPPPPPADGGGAEPIPGQPEAPPADGGTTPPPPPPADGGGAEPIPGQPEAPPADGGTTPPPPPPADGGGAEPIPGQPEAPPADGGTTPPPPPPADGSTTPPPPPPADGGGAAEPVREAPLLDSEKEDAVEGEEPAGQQAEPAEAPPAPASDEEARQEAQPAEVQSAREEEGRRVERGGARRERPEGVDVLREIGDRIVIQLNNQVVVQSDDRGRIGSNAEEVYYEELPRGRTRETVVRPNGVQVVTIYDRYGDVVRRSRIMPDGREYVLVYAERDDREGRRGWRDPGQDLPPLRLRIPRDEYILEAGRVRDPDVYYDFFEQPPVERIQRLYTVDEVRYSARVRDIARRVEMDTITFDFGSATIAEAAIPQLEGVAIAMERLLDENPAETFLIEGHTDAVGSDEANLALSDRRAEAIAMALTNVFGIPPENLVTQGYGERYLKIGTQEAERANRRVVMRRITPLVAPMASR